MMNCKVVNESDGTMLFIAKEHGVGGFVVTGSSHAEIFSKSKLAIQGLCVVDSINYVNSKIDSITERLKTVSVELDSFPNDCHNAVCKASH